MLDDKNLKLFTKDVHNASTKELKESLKTFENATSTTELWAYSVIIRELASRKDRG